MPNDIIEEMNKKHAVINIQGKIGIMNFVYDPVLKRENITLSPEASFKLWYRNKYYKYYSEEKGKDIWKNWDDYWLCSNKRRQYDGIVFDPSGNEYPGYYNLWKGFAVKPIKGNCKLYYDHLKNVVARGDKDIAKYIFAWMADAVQNPADLPGVAFALRGGQGAGKGTLINIFCELFGKHAVQVSDSKHVVGNFNAHLKDCLILFADEAFWAGDKQNESTLKTLITEDKRLVEFKGKDSIQFPNYTRLMMSSNKDWIAPVDFDDRRFFILDVDNSKAKNKTYFDKIYDQMRNKRGLEALLYDLLNFDLSEIDIKNIPSTAAKLDNKLSGMDTVGDWYYSCLCDDELNIAGHTINELYNKYINHCGKLRHDSKNMWARKLKKYYPDLKRIQFAGGGRHYNFPNINVLRDLFEKQIGCRIEWGDL